MDEASERHMELEEDQEPHPDESLVGTSTDQEVVEDEEIIVLQPTEIQGVRRSGRIRDEPERYGFLIDECFVMTNVDDPVKYQHEMKDPESAKWLEAKDVEMQSMREN